MATLYTDHYSKAYVSDPSEAVDPGQVTGNVRVLYAEYTPVANVIGTADVIKLFKLPKGARVINAAVKAPSLGTTGIMTLGHAASVDAVESAASAAFIPAASLDAGGQAVLGLPTAASTGIAKKFAAEVDVQIAFTEATDAALGDTIQAWVQYVLD
jgi:hypothetical protein